jgi:hypothetical protein
LEGTFHDIFHFFATKGAVHYACYNFMQIGVDFVGIIQARRMVREDHGAKERREFAHWEAVIKIVCKERIRTCQVVFLQEEFKGISVVRGLDARETFFMIVETPRR